MGRPDFSSNLAEFNFVPDLGVHLPRSPKSKQELKSDTQVVAANRQMLPSRLGHRSKLYDEEKH